MSKKFKRQDYFRYKRLGKKWRRPVGWQSKLRLQKAGAGLVPGIGWGTPGKMQATLVRNAKDLEKATKFGIIFASALGSKKVAELTKLAKEKGLTILNMKKVKKSVRITKEIEKKKHAKKTKKDEKKEEHKHEEKKEHKQEHAHTEHTHEEKKDEKKTESHEHSHAEHAHEHQHTSEHTHKDGE
jgi:large subunit ribosomal protein L32e